MCNYNEVSPLPFKGFYEFSSWLFVLRPDDNILLHWRYTRLTYYDVRNISDFKRFLEFRRCSNRAGYFAIKPNIDRSKDYVPPTLERSIKRWNSLTRWLERTDNLVD